jgi:DNA polymerase-3 subunit delta'
VADVFDLLIGQARAAEALRRHARHPVQAYLIVGPPGSGTSDALRVFAAALQCPRQGCGNCESCRAVLEGVDLDVTWVERAGLAWRVGEVREAERVGRRRPLGPGRQVVVLEDVELTTTGEAPCATALLKSLEEPPPRTVYLLSATELSPALDTIVSRCVEVRLDALAPAALEALLAREGATPERAAAAAAAAGGNLGRARVLVGDTGLESRLAAWRTLPERLDGTGARASDLVAEVVAALDEALAPLARLQEADLARRDAEARELGQRTATSRRELEAQAKREQRRFRTEELRFGLAALSAVYRERFHEGLAESSGKRASRRAESSLAALAAIDEAHRRLGANVDETLLLTDLLLALSAA